MAHESGTTSFGRNAIGQMTSRTDARGVNVTYGYSDPLSRLKTITYGGGSPDNVTRSYDEESNVTGVASTNGGTYSYDYDELNRMSSQTWTFGGRAYTTSYSYDSAGCLTSITYPTGTAVTMTCDAANRVKTVSASGSIVSAVTYHPSGQPAAMTYGNGKATSIGFDYRARTTSIASAGVLGLTFGYDGADNLKSFDNTAVANSGRTMTYDKLDRLETSVAPSQWGTTAYDYDELGNRTLKSEALTTNYAYDSSNRLVSASPPSGSSTFERYANLTLTWDAAGRLLSTSDGATYLYDGRGRRVQKTDASGATVYHHDDAGRVIAETLPDGTKLRDYIYLGSRLVAVDGCLTTSPPGCAERQWYHVDTLGTPLARTDGSGAVTARFDYRGWGEPWSASGAASADDRQYNGRVFDPGTGFHDYGARMYWPQIGRFVSADTYLGSPGDPASLNRFAYVLNNPYKYVDPTGRRIAPITDPRVRAAVNDARSFPEAKAALQRMEESEIVFVLKSGSLPVSTSRGGMRNFQFGETRSAIRSRSDGSSQTLTVDITMDFDQLDDWNALIERNDQGSLRITDAEAVVHEVSHGRDAAEGNNADKENRAFDMQDRYRRHDGREALPESHKKSEGYVPKP